MSVVDSSDYIKSFEQFYSERLQSGLHKKNKVCKGCSDKKKFIIKKDKLYYTCGSTSGKCGLQVEISLAKYLNYSETKNTHKILKTLLDKTKHPDIYSSEDIKEYDKFIKGSNEILIQATKDFTKVNNLKERITLLQKIHHSRINHKKEQNLLMNKIKNEKDIHKKKELIKEYVLITTKLNEEYNSLYTTCKPINTILEVEKGEVNKDNDVFKDLDKENKKDKKNKIPLSRLSTPSKRNPY